MTDTLVATPDPEGEFMKYLTEQVDDALKDLFEEHGPYDNAAWRFATLPDDGFDWDERWPEEDPFPPPSALDQHPQFIVVRDDDEDEIAGHSVRGRGKGWTHEFGRYPIYGEPLLRGDALWCELAATALNERG